MVGFKSTLIFLGCIWCIAALSDGACEVTPNKSQLAVSNDTTLISSISGCCEGDCTANLTLIFDCPSAAPATPLNASLTTTCTTNTSCTSTINALPNLHLCKASLKSSFNSTAGLQNNVTGNIFQLWGINATSQTQPTPDRGLVIGSTLTLTMGQLSEGDARYFSIDFSSDCAGNLTQKCEPSGRNVTVGSEWSCSSSILSSFGNRCNIFATPIVNFTGIEFDRIHIGFFIGSPVDVVPSPNRGKLAPTMPLMIPFDLTNMASITRNRTVVEWSGSCGASNTTCEASLCSIVGNRLTASLNLSAWTDGCELFAAIVEGDVRSFGPRSVGRLLAPFAIAPSAATVVASTTQNISISLNGTIGNPTAAPVSVNLRWNAPECGSSSLVNATANGATLIVPLSVSSLGGRFCSLSAQAERLGIPITDFAEIARVLAERPLISVNNSRFSVPANANASLVVTGFNFPFRGDAFNVSIQAVVSPRCNNVAIPSNCVVQQNSSSISCGVNIPPGLDGCTLSAIVGRGDVTSAAANVSYIFRAPTISLNTSFVFESENARVTFSGQSLPNADEPADSWSVSLEASPATCAVNTTLSCQVRSVIGANSERFVECRNVSLVGKSGCAIQASISRFQETSSPRIIGFITVDRVNIPPPVAAPRAAPAVPLVSAPVAPPVVAPLAIPTVAPPNVILSAPVSSPRAAVPISTAASVSDNSGAVGGLVAAVVILVLLLVALIIFIVFLKRRKENKDLQANVADQQFELGPVAAAPTHQAHENLVESYSDIEIDGNSLDPVIFPVSPLSDGLPPASAQPAFTAVPAEPFVAAFPAHFKLESNFLQNQRRKGDASFGQILEASYKGHNVLVRNCGAMVPENLMSSVTLAFVPLLSVAPHPNIASYVAVGPDSSGNFLVVSNSCKDGKIAKFFGKGFMDAETKIGTYLDIAEGLLHLHQAGIVHGELSANNISVDGGQSKLVEFGIAHAITSGGVEVQAFRVIDSRLWDAPEQLVGQNPTPASDVWSFGVTMVEIWSESSPFRGSDNITTLQHIRDNAEAPKIPTTMPVDLQDICQRCFLKDPSRRITTRELRDALGNMKNQADTSESDSVESQ